MGAITGTNGTVTRTFTCAQYALLGGSLPSGFTITENTCGIYLNLLRSPFASFGLELSGTALPGSWYDYEAIITLDKVEIPTGVVVLPSNPRNVWVIVRRQNYHPDVPGDERDFLVNTVGNSIDFHVSGTKPSLNGQTAYIRVFK